MNRFPHGRMAAIRILPTARHSSSGMGGLDRRRRVAGGREYPSSRPPAFRSGSHLSFLASVTPGLAAGSGGNPPGSKGEPGRLHHPDLPPRSAGPSDGRGDGGAGRREDEEGVHGFRGIAGDPRRAAGSALPVARRPAGRGGGMTGCPGKRPEGTPDRPDRPPGVMGDPHRSCVRSLRAGDPDGHSASHPGERSAVRAEDGTGGSRLRIGEVPGGGAGAPSGNTGVPDVTVPTVSSPSTVNGATSVADNTAFSVTFSEPMKPATINATTFTVKAAMIAETRVSSRGRG